MEPDNQTDPSNCNPDKSILSCLCQVLFTATRRVINIHEEKAKGGDRMTRKELKAIF
jgi:hypothetical protein